ncbi:MAG: RdgB/HAM1 family non-canonical purine NTP pyrophosphatase [Rhodospirillaceae bacterium]|nr:RdgB/HAM1 family non-canonical purine NTP pyrophosphatase [Rhodospirillaceae bacterium]
MSAEPGGRLAASRRLLPGRLVIASRNQGKVREIADLLRPFGVEAIAADKLSLAEPEETGDSFVANAEIKARAAATSAGLPALADDSGLAVAALGGAPGILSARWAGPTKDFAAAMRRVETELAGRADRRARFVCALALAWPDGRCETFTGEVDGVLVWPPRGERGFGYDPVFLPNGRSLTFGEMDPSEKHAISHRARAFGLLVGSCWVAPS